MADTHFEVEKTPQQKNAQQEAHQRLLDDTSFNKYLTGADNSNQLSGITSTAFGRSAYALAEGVTLTPHGIFNAVQHEWNNPSEFLAKAAGGAAFGVGLRLLLPKQGAAKALVGTTMSYFLIRDVARPMIETVQDASMAQTMDEVHAASTKMGNALGTFTVDSAIAMTSGALAEAGTGYVLNKTASGRQLEAWKEVTFNSDQTAVGRFFKWSERTADKISGKVADSLLGRDTVIEDLPIQRKLELIAEAQRQAHAVRTNAENLSSALRHRKEYRSNGFSDKIDVLLTGAEVAPAQVRTFDVQSAEQALTHGPKQNQARIAGLTEAGGEHAPGPAPRGDGGGTARPTETGGGAKPTPTETGGGTTKPTDGGGGAKPTDGGGAKPNDAPKVVIEEPAFVPTKGELGSENVGNMATTLRKAAGDMTKEDFAVQQVVEDMKGPVLSTMRGGKPPLDEGHFSNNQMLAALADQVKTADEVRQVGMLLDHFRTANQQLELAVNRQHGGLPAILDLNQYSRSIHAELLTALDKNGIPRTVLRGTNSPMFTIRDSDGAGPYTIPAIPGVSDAAVVTYPREYHGKAMAAPDRPSMVGVHTAGVYPHELGHDLIYGDLAKFPEQSRSGWLNDRVVKQAMDSAKITDVEIQVPGAPGGVMKKSDFFVQLLKAQANENTADMFGASIDPNTGLSLAVLLGSLRKPSTGSPNGPGLLETRSMYGKEMIDPRMENSLGIEPHGIDRWRIKLTAETLRHLSKGHEGILKYADNLDTLANSMARPGKQYVWANVDEPGKFVAIPMHEWDAIIPTLVKAQFDTPLASLNNHALRDLAPNMAERFPKIDNLSKSISEAALKGQSTVHGFEKGNYRIEEVMSSGLSAWVKALEANGKLDAGVQATPMTLMDRVNAISETLRAQYRDDVPELSVPGPKQPARIADVATKPLGFMARMTGEAAKFQPHLRERFVQNAGFLSAYAGTQVIGVPLSATLKDLQESQRIQQDMFNQGGAKK